MDFNQCKKYQVSAPELYESAGYNTMGTTIRILLVESDSTYAANIQSALACDGKGRFHVEWVAHLKSALERLGRGNIALILLDLSLPDAQGLDVFEQVSKAAPETLILILTLAQDEATAHQAVQSGAYDYFIIDKIDLDWLSRALSYAIKNKTERDALNQSEARFRAISDASPLGIFVSDAQGGCIFTNAAYQSISGLDFEQTLGTRWTNAIHPEDRQRVLAEWRTAVACNSPFQAEFRFLQRDSSIVWTRVNSAAMYGGLEPYGYIQTVEDITERKSAELLLREAEERLFEEKERAQVTLNSIGDAVLVTDPSGNITYLNPMAESMTGWSCEESLGHPIRQVFNIIDGVTRQAAVNPVEMAIAHDSTVGLSANCVLIRRDGVESVIEDSAAPLHDRAGKIVGAVIVFRDVSQSRDMAQKMSYLAQHDFLTGLPNRALLTELLSQAIAMARRNKQKQVALLFLDLDDFKRINDSLGHAIGDKLLHAVADRLVSAIRTTDTACRQGGDEFVLLLSEIGDPLDAGRVAEGLLAGFTKPYLIDGHELHITASIGISVYPSDGDDMDTIMQNADTAMFHAKSSGRNGYQFFKAEMNTLALHRLEIETNLRRALKDGEFSLNYQPQINLETGKIIGVEALIRWQDPELGVIPPNKFVHIAEACGLIVPIGRWVLREACRQTQRWMDESQSAVPVSVNISATEFRHIDFLEVISKVLRETGLPPDMLELELTESILMNDTLSSSTLLKSLKEMGVRLAIDDFGTGFSNLSHLKSLPIDTLKIDQSFVRDITSDADDAFIVSAVINMGKNLKQRIIAEGVETDSQLAFLRDHQCEVGQGFYFSQPLSAGSFTQFLENGPH
jgi:diguanylate cyclase (GGDEF)-like protein/PAS domain S-box-containing protein